MRFKPFANARSVVHRLQLKSKKEWYTYSSSSRRPNDIPSQPYRTYKNEWRGWGDWLGTGRIANQIKGWSIEKVKELLGGLIESRAIYDWDEALPKMNGFELYKKIRKLDNKVKWTVPTLTYLTLPWYDIFLTILFFP